MRWIILLAILALLAAAAAGLGWLYVRGTEEKIEIIIDKEEVVSDIEEVIERGREWIDETADDAGDPAVEREADVPVES